MSRIQYVNAVKLAQDNLEEANRQLTHAKQDYAEGNISPERLHQLEELRNIAAQDLQRVIKES
jgi:predicted nucleic acid-binding OB-fold protein